MEHALTHIRGRDTTACAVSLPPASMPDPHLISPLMPYGRATVPSVSSIQWQEPEWAWVGG
jgi:hypothetical protein